MLALARTHGAGRILSSSAESIERIMLPSPDTLNEFPHGKFVLSNLAAKRAKQLKEGAIPLIQTDSTHPLTIALAEIAAGKIKAILPTLQPLAAVDAELPIIPDEPLPAEFGMLLPALDETEAALVTGDALVGEEDHEEIEGDGEILSLSDLVGEEEEESAAPLGDEDTLSLSDIAEQESSEDEEPEE